jgi:hypothetical protein
MSVRLEESRSATVGSSGTATVTLGPQRGGEWWKIKRVTVQNSGTVLVPTAKVYRGPVSETRLIDGTFTGTFDIDNAADIPLSAGEFITVQWTGADVNSRCTVTVEGDQDR